MPPKRKRDAGKFKSQTGGRRPDKGKKNNEQAQAQNAVTGALSPATETMNRAPNPPTQKARNAQSQSILFKLPLESLARRRNQYTLENFNSKHFALNKTCTSIKEEIEEFVLPKVAFTFLSTDAFACFLGGRTSYYGFYLDAEIDEYTSKLLQKITKVEVKIQNPLRWYCPFEALDWIQEALELPLNIEFFDYDCDGNDTSRACQEAIKRWDQWMQELEALQAKKN
ncbi:hypothetical protein KCU65_g5707, partial [Aureobasidium melanogenum]